jgi:hypothetical protein
MKPRGGSTQANGPSSPDRHAPYDIRPTDIYEMMEGTPPGKLA